MVSFVAKYSDKAKLYQINRITLFFNMPYLKNKSEINIYSAELLHKNNCYSSSTHCAYYSCVQLMKYIICNKIGVNYDKQLTEISQLRSLRAKRTGSHNYMIDKIEDSLISFDKREAALFINLIEDLKDFREKSDYGNIEILSQQSIDSITKAKEIRTQLINFFHI